MYEHKGFIALLRFAHACGHERDTPRRWQPGVSGREERRKTGTPKPVYYSKRRLVLPLAAALSNRRKEAGPRGAQIAHRLPRYFLAGFIRGQPSSADNAVDRFCRPRVPSTLLFSREIAALIHKCNAAGFYRFQAASSPSTATTVLNNQICRLNSWIGKTTVFRNSVSSLARLSVGTLGFNMYLFLTAGDVEQERYFNLSCFELHLICVTRLRCFNICGWRFYDGWRCAFPGVHRL